MMVPVLPVLLVLQVLSCTGTLKPPTVFISILVRNKEHTLPYFLTQLYNLDYPKNRIVLHIRTQNNEDRSLELLNMWLESIIEKKEYHNIIKEFYPCTPPCLLEGEESPVGWFQNKFSHIMTLRQQSLRHARFSLADFFWSLDSDVFLTDSSVLSFLVNQNLTVVAPMLPSIGRYSNFWGGMSESFYYERVPLYSTILDRKEVGCFEVPMVHSSVLVNLRQEEADLISYTPEDIKDYPGPHDDIIVFALSCSLNGIPMHVCNQKEFGIIMLPLDDDQKLSDDLITLQNTLAEVTVKNPPLIPDPIFQRFLPSAPESSKLGLDEIYMINLERRKDRKERMEYNFKLLGIEYRLFPAMDGADIGPVYLAEHGIKMLPGFSEPYHGRPLKMGEIGCFMSHYNLWQDVLEKNHDMVLILEDDIRFEPYFISKLQKLLKELRERRNEWDLTFLGRKRSKNAKEPWLSGSDQLVEVDYTYWTLAYLLTKEGARRLVQGNPLDKMVPVDEYLPIMYDRHPNSTWKSYFTNRDLKGLSVEPLLVYPTHYTGEPGYISDTEGTSIIELPSSSNHPTSSNKCQPPEKCSKDEF